MFSIFSYLKNRIMCSIFLIFCIMITFFIMITSIICLFNIKTSYLLTFKNKESSINITTKKYAWPLPGYTRISSYFGKRDSPTRGASSYHQGIDIPAPEGAKIYSIGNGTIISLGWSGSGGYCISIKLNTELEKDITVSYCHVSPKFIVNVNDYVLKNQCIGFVGPKNIYAINNNPYRDAEGKPTNGATTGCHLHITIKEYEKVVDPLKYY